VAAGLANANIRLKGPVPDAANSDSDSKIIVDVTPADEGPVPEFDNKGNVLSIKFPDGSIQVSTDGKPLEQAKTKEKKGGWYRNLADDIGDETLSGIADSLLRDIEQDIASRKDWIDAREQGIKLLGLKIEVPNLAGASDGAPVEGMSKVRHPLLLEAVLRFQANARSELLPTDGPVKIRNDDPNTTPEKDKLANDFEMDFNHYLTAVATEYYPDTDRMLLMTGFGGDGFKKVYKCPLRGRPVSESVDADDLIVNQSCTDLANARRITHKTLMRPSVVKRLQILDVYRDVELGDPLPPKEDAQKEAENEQAGITPSHSIWAKDRDREIYECYCELDIPGFEHKHKGKASGLEIPYIVTLDVSSRTILALTRNYAKTDDELPVARKRFVKYPFIPGFGFLGIGLLHILGNSTNAVTAAWRILLDSGMFSNFPGFLMADTGGRQNTNIFRVPPGGSALVKTNGMKIGDSVTPLPYSSANSPALMSLVENVVETGQRVGGTAEMQVGEGRETQPVGTTMALIDQAIKVMSSVHKRLHAAQAEEFQLLKEVFKENPESFWMRKCKSRREWNVQEFLAACDNCELVPQADPNTSSKGERVMKVTALIQLQQLFQNLFDPVAIVKAALTAMGWGKPEQFLVPPQAMSQPPPEMVQMQQKMANEQQAAQAKTMEAQARMTEANAKAGEAQSKILHGHFAPKGESAAAPEQPEQDTPSDTALAQAKLMDSQTRAREVAIKGHEVNIENRNRDADRSAKETDTAIGLAKELLKPPPAPKAAGKTADGKPKAAPKAPKAPSAEKVASQTKEIIAKIKTPE
jgi:hypothetical protein